MQKACPQKRTELVNRRVPSLDLIFNHRLWELGRIFQLYVSSVIISNFTFEHTIILSKQGH